jgi:hypothetical protein
MLDAHERNLILTFQLLIARAAQKDSLKWWEDDALTPSGKYLLERLFLVDADEASRKLAIEAAKVRFQAAFGNENNVLHLFHLDQTGDVEHSLQGINLSSIPVPSESIQSIDDLRQMLLEHVGSPMKYQVVGERSSNRLEIKRGEAHSKSDLIHIVKTLAWATLESEPGKPVFPYFQQTV